MIYRMSMICIAALLLSIAVPSYAQTQELPPLDLDTLIKLALEENPEIQALEKRTEALRHVIPQAKSLDDPMVGVGFTGLPAGSLALGETSMGGLEFMVRQRVPYPGKLALRGEIAEHAVGESDAQYRDRINNIIARLKRAYLDYLFVNQSITVTRENREILQQFIEIADVRYAVGQGIQQDTLKARVELAKIVDELLILTQMRETARGRINALLNRPPQSPLGEPVAVQRTEIPFTLGELQQLSLDNRPMLDMYRSGIARFQAARELAERDLKPDFEFSAGYMARSRIAGEPMSGRDLWSGSVMINLPIYAKNKQRQKILEEAANIEVLQAEFQAARTETFFEIQDILANIEKSRKQVELFETGIIPQAEMALESSLSAYQAGDVDFLTLLDNLLTLYRYQIEYYNALTEHERFVSDLEHVTGRLF